MHGCPELRLIISFYAFSSLHPCEARASYPGSPQQQPLRLLPSRSLAFCGDVSLLKLPLVT